ncbi:TonB-dependent receptor [Pedobacter kyungheensis]|uniref:TonB-dependent receptor n=1 Tax=Pedobacter kyungheensis TaxID=1069985 RepID=A0A0C1FVJ1_9SPHI|nr:SusC/RagA family TonB-linked outer membrane protein [Pedobacter kyungheensis]KIA91874.1 TonB-dependent receptor [Pedobacter kyungheensis]
MKHFYKMTLGIVALLCLMLRPEITSAQTKISGIVKDDAQQPIPGVSVLVKGTKKAISTDLSGRFTIDAKTGETLLLSSIGFISQEVQVSGNTLAIILKTDSKNLNEVVVTALGIRKEKRNLGYAIQEVKGADLVKAREANPVNGLVGKVAGLTVGVSSELLGRSSLYLRGNNVNLVVVDGVPINSDTWNINPDDIDTYTVLKGPAAAALYGYQAYNGALLITTKKGKLSDKGFVVELNSSTQFNKGFIALPKSQDEYGPGEHSAYAFGDGKGGGLNDGDYDIWGPKFEGQLIPQYDSPVDANGVRQGTPWVARGKDNLKRFIQTGLLSANNVALSSATDKYNLRVSVSNNYQKGIIPNTQLNINNFNVSGSYNISPKLKAEAYINYSRQFSDNIPDVNYGPNSVIYNMTLWGGADWNIDDMKNYWQAGKEGIQSIYAEYQRYHNPYFMSYEWLRGHKKNDINGYASLNYNLTKDLDVMLKTQISTYDQLRTEKMPFSAHPYGREEGLGDYREDRRSMFENNTQLLLKYNKNVGDLFEISAFGGGNARNFSYNSSFTTTDYLNVPNVYNFSNSKNPVKAFNFNSNMLVLSAFYSVDISFKKYLNINTTGRVDKNSALSPSNNSAFYPSVSLSSVVSDYVKMPAFISFAKVRASYANVKDPGLGTLEYIGATPLQTYPLGYGAEYTSSYGGPGYGLSSPYSVRPTYNNQTGAYYTDNLIDLNAVKAQSRTNYEGGIDLKFLKNRLGFEATYFRYIDGPKIIKQNISPATGYQTNTINGRKTQNSGVELSLSGTPVLTDKFGWDVMVNWSTYKQIYKELAPGETSVDQFFKAGDRIDNIYGSVLAKSPSGQVIHTSSGTPISLPVNQLLGHADPNWVWSISNKFRYQNFSFSFQLDGKVGGVMQDYVRLKSFQGGRQIETIQGKMGEARYQDYVHVNDPNYKGTWVGDGVVLTNNGKLNFDPVTGVITNYDQLAFAPNTTPVLLQDYLGVFYGAKENTMMSRTYAKLREVTFGYQLPKKLLEGTFIRSANFSVVGRNLLYFINSTYNDVDVDQYSGREGTSTLQTPTTRSIGFNLNVTF